MKSICYILPLILLLGSGCSSSTGFFGRQSGRIEKQSVKIQSVEDKLSINQNSKINQVSQLSFGVGNSLDRITNKPIEVKVASELNQKLLTVAGLPSVDEQTVMIKMVSDLILQNEAGKLELKNKDKELAVLQAEETFLVKMKEKEIDKLNVLAKDTALKADTTQNQLDAYKGWFGIKAIALGFKQLITTSIYFIIGFLVLYFVLRLLADSNPILGALFSIVNVFGSVFIHMIQSIAPKALDLAGNVSKEAYNKLNDTVYKLVDSIEVESAKNNLSITSLKETIDKSFNEENKTVIQNVKTDLLYK